MTIKELIERLREYPEDTIVRIYDGDSEEMEDITGFLYEPIGKIYTSEGIIRGPVLEFCSDEI